MDTSKEYIKMCDCEEIQSKRTIFPLHSKEQVAHIGCTPTGDFSYSNTGEFVWLPRQDQLQDMIYDKEFGTSEIRITNFSDKFKLQKDVEEESFYGETLEQCWLLFYMKEKHNKTWDGKWPDEILVKEESQLP